MFSSGQHFPKALQRALQWSKDQRAIANALTEMYDSKTIDKWAEVVAAWHRDHTQVDPYAEPEPCKPHTFATTNSNPKLTIIIATTYSAVRLELAIEEAADARAGVPSLHKLSPSAFLRQALDIEEKQ